MSAPPTPDDWQRLKELRLDRQLDLDDLAMLDRIYVEIVAAKTAVRERVYRLNRSIALREKRLGLLTAPTKPRKAISRKTGAEEARAIPADHRAVA